eukprot:m.188401 g.188401  ORF g.188401 m.188401 type:complete len:50 (+) comp39379_c0_seq2:585-734(+)
MNLQIISIGQWKLTVHCTTADLFFGLPILSEGVPGDPSGSVCTFIHKIQ